MGKRIFTEEAQEGQESSRKRQRLSPSDDDELPEKSADIKSSEDLKQLLSFRQDKSTLRKSLSNFTMSAA
jgi:hypothetical protein